MVHFRILVAIATCLLLPCWAALAASQDVAEGVKYETFSHSGVTVHMVTIDRAHGEYEFRVMAKEMVSDNSKVSTDSVLHLASTHAPQAIVAINGYMWSGPEGTEPGQTADLNSTTVMNYNVKKAWTNDKRVAGFAPFGMSLAMILSEYGDWKSGPTLFHHYALGSDFPLVKDGVCIAQKPSGSDARTAIGYSDKSIILVSTTYAVTDGLTKEDLCDLFIKRGVQEAVALDGGPSSAMVVNGQLVNPLPWYLTKYKYPAGHRFVATAIGVVRACVSKGQPSTAQNCCPPTKNVDGTCCAQDCGGKQCGSDGCGKLCGTCTSPAKCDDASGQCEPCKGKCDGKTCGSNGCGGFCGTGECCKPKCDGKQCGDDGCGDECGQCVGGICASGLCVPLSADECPSWAFNKANGTQNWKIINGKDSGFNSDDMSWLIDPNKSDPSIQRSVDFDGAKCKFFNSLNMSSNCSTQDYCVYFSASNSVKWPDDGFGASAFKCACKPDATYTVSDGGDCDDSKPQVNPGKIEQCNGIDDNCKDGIDEGQISACDDGLPCTADFCTGGKCANQLQSGFCKIGGTCQTTGAQQPGQACFVCSPATSTVTWSPADRLRVAGPPWEPRFRSLPPSGLHGHRKWRLGGACRTLEHGAVRRHNLLTSLHSNT